MKKLTSKHPKLLYIEWEDITSWMGWSEERDIENRNPDTIIQTGFFLGEDKRYLTICTKYAYDQDPNKIDQFGTVCKIPKACILFKKTIKL